MTRILSVGGSFAIVLAAYLAYATVAVPLIEPTVQWQDASGASSRDPESVRRDYARRRQTLVGLFPDGSWPLDNAKILASEKVKLVFQDYANLGGGKVEIRPCAIIFTPDGPADTQAERNRRSIVLETPEGALLEFDEAFDLSRMTVGQLKTGLLKGQVTIRSAGKQPGPEDNLTVVTRDVEMTDSRIHTPHAVLFSLGPNHGCGEQMTIKLLTGDGESGSNRHGPDIAGIESFEIRRLKQLHLEFDDTEDLSAFGSEKGSEKGDSPILAARTLESGEGDSPIFAARKSGQSPGSSKLAIEIGCRGPFRFDPIRQLITFEDQVDVLRLHPDGPSDQMNCELLSIYLARPRTAVDDLSKQPADDSTPKRPPMMDLRPRRIEAVGNPVVVFAPSEEVQVRGKRMEYDFQSGRIVLDGSREVFLKQGDNEIHAPSLEYQPDDAAALGQVIASGPGWLRGRMDGRLEEPLEARWSEQLQVRTVDRQQVISLTGGAELGYGQLGKLTAGEIHFWLFESESSATATGNQPRLRPDRMMAKQQVQLDSTQLSGAVEQLEVWFEQDESIQVPSGPPTDPVASGWGLPQFSRGENGTVSLADRGVVPGQVVRLPVCYSGSLRTVRRPGSQETLVPVVGRPVETLPGQHFEIIGGLLRARMKIRSAGPELTELMIEDDVRLSETRNAQADKRPMVLSGQRIHLVDATKPHASVTVVGSPAHFEGRGLGLTGSNINLNQGTNRLWIDGPGWMDLPLDRDFAGNPLPVPERLSINWQERMTFDGRTAVFEGSIVASSRHQRLQTERFDVSLKKPIRFDEPPKGEPADAPIEEIRCGGGVFMENRSFDENGQSSHDKAQLADLSIHLTSGQIDAAGPGWMTTVRRGSARSLFQPDDVRTNANQPDDSRLSYLNVRFQGSLEGNLHDKELTFRDRVQAIYGPVDSWETTLRADDPDLPGPGGALVNCDQLTVAEMPVPGSDSRNVELAAEGNVEVEGRTDEGQTFFARATRMTYAEAKDLLILEGDGRTDAELYYQQHPGSPFHPFVANRIRYRPSTQERWADGFKSLEWSQE